MTAKLFIASTDVRLSVDDGTTVTVSSAVSPNIDGIARIAINGLLPDTEYTYQTQIDGELYGPSGRFRTLSAASGTAFSFTIAMSGDAETNSANPSFDRISSISPKPLMFLHLGDMHYENISTNSPLLFHAAYDRVFRCEPQAKLYREIPTVYVWDDHDYGPNNADGTSASKPAAAAAYRSRVPHYPLEESTSVYHSFDIGRVRFIVTDQRSAASTNATTDGPSKTMLGTAQKTWFKNLLQNSPNKLIVWVCPRHFTNNSTPNADNWGGFVTERAEIGAHVAANCPGRVIVLSADAHVLGIDNGSNRIFGGASFPTFQVAPLDKIADAASAIFSEGVFTNTGQYGTMAVSDSGGSSIGVTWKGFDTNGLIITYSFSVSI